MLLTVSPFPQSINSRVFKAWVSQDLLPKLLEKSILVMDNASFHKSNELKKLVEKEDHNILFLPLYSPDLNPIEQKWSQAKTQKRRKQYVLWMNCFKMKIYNQCKKT